jgi:MOSC domain-containing protein YiiM
VINLIKIIAVCSSNIKGVRKIPLEWGLLKVEFGLEGDAHAGGDDAKRQISLLAFESIEKMNTGSFSYKPGDFAENFTTSGIDLVALPIGTKLRIGDTAIIETTQIGKTCHKGCAISKLSGRCIMPTEGVFARVITGGLVKPDDPISVL